MIIYGRGNLLESPPVSFDLVYRDRAEGPRLSLSQRIPGCLQRLLQVVIFSQSRECLVQHIAVGFQALFLSLRVVN